MEHDEKPFGQSLKVRENNFLENSFCSLSLRLKNPQNIYKTSKQITGLISLIPKVPMLNIPIEVTILGESQCTVFEEQVSQGAILVRDIFEGPRSFRIHETEQEFVERKNEVEKCLQSTQYLSQSYTENNKRLPQHSHKEIFLQGKQQLFQTRQQKQGQPQQKKIKVLEQNQIYNYEFSFFLPPNVPISVNNKIFAGVHLYVGYRIEVGFEMDEKFLLCEEGKKAKHLRSVKNLKVSEEFDIKRVLESIDERIVANKLSFKYFNSQGQIQDDQSSLTSCFIKCFCPSIWRRSYCYDLYHCELLTSIDEFYILHLTARIFLEPNKDKIDVRKVKKGKLYMTNKKADPSETDENQPKGKSSMTNSKIMPQKETKNDIKIHQLEVIFYGEIVGVKKVIIFQKIVSLDRENYDAVQGELILELTDKYFSQKNELFEIRYWFQIEPICENQNDPSEKYVDKAQSSTKDGQFNEFDITMGKLTGKSHSKKKPKSGESKEQNKNMSSSTFKVQNVSEWHRFIQL